MSDSDSATPSGEDAFPKSLASGSLSIGEKKVECHVLSDGRRVLDTSQAQAIFGAAKDRHFRRLLSRIPNASRYFKVRPGLVVEKRLEVSGAAWAVAVFTERGGTRRAKEPAKYARSGLSGDAADVHLSAVFAALG